MRLALINYEYPPLGGGAANATQFIARELVRQGHHVIVITGALRGAAGIQVEDGVRVHRLSSLRRRKDRSNVVEMALFVCAGLACATRICRQENIGGCIAFFSVPSGLVALLLRLRLSIHYVVSLRGGDVPGLVPELNLLHRLIAPMRRKILGSALRVAANAPDLAQLSMRVDPFLVDVIPNGVDLEFYRPGARDKCERRPFVFLFVGRLTTQKNLALVLEAIAALRRRSRRPFLLEVVGDGPLRVELEARSRRLGVDPIVRWRGWYEKSQLRDAYQKADCFLNPSFYEGMPNTVLEAMASGLPVVASDIGGNRDLVEPSVTGMLIRIDDPEELVAALCVLLEFPERARHMGEAGRRRAGESFSWADVAARYVDLLEGERKHDAPAV